MKTDDIRMCIYTYINHFKKTLPSFFKNQEGSLI